MFTPASFGILRRTVLCAAGMLAANLSGCAAVSQHFAGMYNAVVTKCQVHQDLAEIRQDTREALIQEEVKSRKLAAERDVEAARMAAERQRLEMQFCQANQEALQKKVKHNIREQLEHKVSFNVEQGLELGELEVDVEGLQALIKQREQEAQKKPPDREPQKRPCKCCDQPCGCEPGLIRRLCHRCRHKPCEAEKTCGGPEALARAEQEAVKKPLRPAEIPLRIPVRLTFGMQGPEMEAARIRRLPYPQDNEPLERGPCTLPCNDPSCPACTKAAPAAPMPKSGAADMPVAPTAPDDPPIPSVDEEARRQKTSPAPSKRISRKPTVFPDFVWRDLSGQPSAVQPAAASRKVDAR
ncbi:MAG: hypothetical protein ACR2FY_09000 [Pirellulaceae bacterium]